MGGTSAEREISLRSGKAVYNALKGLGYNVVAIDAGLDLCDVLKKENVEITDSDFMDLRDSSFGREVKV